MCAAASLMPVCVVYEHFPGRYRLDITERESEVVVTNSPFFPVINASTFDPAFSTASGICLSTQKIKDVRLTSSSLFRRPHGSRCL
jgi:hypothetical protein